MNGCLRYYLLRETVISFRLISDHTHWCNPGPGPGLCWQQQGGSAEGVAASAF